MSGTAGSGGMRASIVGVMLSVALAAGPACSGIDSDASGAEVRLPDAVEVDGEFRTVTAATDGSIDVDIANGIALSGPAGVAGARADFAVAAIRATDEPKTVDEVDVIEIKDGRSHSTAWRLRSR